MPTGTTLGDSRSRCPSTTFSTGEVAVERVNNGLETKTCTRMVDGLASVGNPGVTKLLLLPQDSSTAQAAATSRMASADCLKRRAPKDMRNGELDARNGIIAEPFPRCAPGRISREVPQGLKPLARRLLTAGLKACSNLSGSVGLAQANPGGARQCLPDAARRGAGRTFRA